MRLANPGVYRQDLFPTLPPALYTGVPVFLGLTTTGDYDTPTTLTLNAQFTEIFGGVPRGGYLDRAVAGFFQNGGRFCYVVRLRDRSRNALVLGLEASEVVEADLVCAPDVVGAVENVADLVNNPAAVETVVRLQTEVLSFCQATGDRFAILDSLLGETPAQIRDRADRLTECGSYGALYAAWLQVVTATGLIAVPACGHIAGAYARNDREIGPYAAPANLELEGIVDAVPYGSVADSARLFNEGCTPGVNALQVFPGRGLRIWGARTLSRSPNWQHINVRRLFITVARWMQLNLADQVFEPNELRLWIRIERELSAFLSELYQRGAFRGSSPEEAFFVRCDPETNPSTHRDAGILTVEVGLAVAVPGEFIVVRLVQDASGMAIDDG